MGYDARGVIVSNSIMALKALGGHTLPAALAQNTAAIPFVTCYFVFMTC